MQQARVWGQEQDPDPDGLPETLTFRRPWDPPRRFSTMAQRLSSLSLLAPQGQGPVALPGDRPACGPPLVLMHTHSHGHIPATQLHSLIHTHLHSYYTTVFTLTLTPTHTLILKSHTHPFTNSHTSTYKPHISHTPTFTLTHIYSHSYITNFY